jgi:hypothetical protein
MFRNVVTVILSGVPRCFLAFLGARGTKSKDLVLL